MSNLRKGGGYTQLKIIDEGAFRYSGLTSIEIPASVTSVGYSAFYNAQSLKMLEFADNSQLTTIGGSAFRNTAITSLVVPVSVTMIGENAFKDCSSLATVVFESNSQLTTIDSAVFEGCAMLTSVVLPNNLITIKSSAFSQCKSLASIVIPASVTTIEGSAFWSCLNLKTVTNNSSLIFSFGATTYGYITYYADTLIQNGQTYTKIIEGGIEYLVNGQNITIVGVVDNTLSTYSIKEGVTNIPTTLFKDNTNITSITIPASVTMIGSFAFSDCTSLANVTFAENSQLAIIGDDAFRNTAITSIVVPASVREIKYSAFYNITTLETVTFAEESELTMIGESAFASTGLTSIVVPSSVTSIEDKAFYNCRRLESVTNLSSLTFILNETTNGYIAYYAKVLIQDGNTYGAITEGGIEYIVNVDSISIVRVVDNTLSTYSIKEGVTNIHASLFANNTSIKSITIPSSVQTIGSKAFYKCTNLETVTFAEGSQLKTIADAAFERTKLGSIVIPASVTSIGGNAFLGITTLHAVVNLSDLVVVSGVDNNTTAGRLGWYSDIVFKNEVVWTTSTQNGVNYRIYTAKDGGNVKFVTKDNTTVQEQASFKVAYGVENNALNTYSLVADIDAIGYNVFENNENLSHITIPAGVKSIGYSAFAGCTNLAVVCNLSCIQLTDLSHETGDYGYITWYLGELYTTSIDVVETTINNVKYLDIYSSSDASRSTLLDRVVYGYDSALRGKVVLDEKATVIAYKAFEGANITSVTLPANFRKIQYKAFDSGVSIVLNNSVGWQQYNSGAWVDLSSDSAASIITNNKGYVYKK